MPLAIAAWLAIYTVAARRSPAWLAGVVVFLVSSNPASLTYERICSSDVIVGALGALAFAGVTARRPAAAIAGGIALAGAFACKASAYLLLPVALLGAATAPGQRGRRLLLFGASLLGAFGALQWGRQIAAGTAAALAACSRWEFTGSRRTAAQLPKKSRALMYNDVFGPHNAWVHSGARLAVAGLGFTLALGRPWLTNLLRNTPLRLGMGLHYPTEEFLDKVATLLPHQPVYWLVDGDEDLQWERSRAEVHRRWRVSHATTVQIPSGDLLRVRHVAEPLPFVRVHLTRLHPPAE